MPSDSSERRFSKPNQMGTPPSEPEKLQCPRCDSSNTKFCYYNNYNFSQPRHFCKTCRRYWTHGGTLRDIPVGGCNRKNKRSRTLPSSTGATSSSSAAQSGQDYRRVTVPASTSQLLASLSGADQLPLSFLGDLKTSGNVYGSFTSLLNTHGPGLFAFGGIGLGFGTGLEETGYGLGRGVARPYQGFGMGEVGPTAGTGLTLNGNHWPPLESEEEVGHCFPYSSSGVARSMVSNNNFL